MALRLSASSRIITSSCSSLFRAIIYCNFNTTTIDRLKKEQNAHESNGRFNNDEIQHEKNKFQPSKKLPAIIRDPFYEADKKTKNSYLDVIQIYKDNSVQRRHHVEFIYAALKHMAEFNVQHDLQVYKALIDVMPKGKLIPTNVFQAEFMHYPKQQQCIIDLLEQMEDFGVIPDYEMEAMLLNVFGRSGYPLRKYWRMMYWMPKFKNASPWLLPNPMPDDALIIAKLAVERMCTVDDRSEITVFNTCIVQEAVDQTWIVSGMSPDQSELLKKQPTTTSLYIEGPFLIWLRSKSINYFTLRADPISKLHDQPNNEEYDVDEDDVANLKVPFFGQRITERTIQQAKKLKTIHEQDDGTIFAICATGTSTKDSLLSWIRLLERNGNPILGSLPILFRFHSDVKDPHKQIEAIISNKAPNSV